MKGMWQTPVVCMDCDLKWLYIRCIRPGGTDLRMFLKERRNCPRCGSRKCKLIEGKNEE